MIVSVSVLYWLTFNVWWKRAGNGAASNVKYRVADIRPLHANSRTVPLSCLLMVCEVRLFMSFVELLP